VSLSVPSGIDWSQFSGPAVSPHPNDCHPGLGSWVAIRVANVRLLFRRSNREKRRRRRVHAHVMGFSPAVAATVSAMPGIYRQRPRQCTGLALQHSGSAEVAQIVLRPNPAACFTRRSQVATYRSQPRLPPGAGIIDAASTGWRGHPRPYASRATARCEARIVGAPLFPVLPRHGRLRGGGRQQQAAPAQFQRLGTAQALAFSPG
jgi:hypothetical protein